MDISANHSKSGEYQLAIGPVTFSLPSDAISALGQVVEQRLNQNSSIDAENIKRKLQAYRALASKMIGADDQIIQKFAPQLTPEQLVTMARLADGDGLYQKVMRNLSKQNCRQFEEDFATMNKITEHSACVYMEQIVPLIKKTAQEQKKLQGAERV